MLQFAAGSFHTKKLRSRLYSTKVEVHSQKRQIRFFLLLINVIDRPRFYLVSFSRYSAANSKPTNHSTPCPVKNGATLFSTIALASLGGFFYSFIPLVTGMNTP